MKIAIASGKGGTGKTMVSASLIHVWPQPVVAVDLDVEAPNLHLFLHPQITRVDPVFMNIPQVDASKCTLCRACADLCQFKALSILGTTLLIFEEMCHGCGGCMRVCPENALHYGRRTLGEICRGETDGTQWIMGRLRIGEAMSPPLMRAVKNELASMKNELTHDVIIDAPPGVSCPAVTAVMDCDAIVLVTEPTPFGLYDLKLAYDAFKPLGIPMGVVVNRAGIGLDDVFDFCAQAKLTVLARIPYSRDIAETYAAGRVIAASSREHRTRFESLAAKILKLTTTGKEIAHA